MTTRAGAAELLRAAADRAAAALLLVLALPLLLAAALLIVLDDPGPVLHRQVRVGRDGRKFGMWKLRTMRRANTAIASKHRDDPRITRAGRLLRRLSLDELPQLISVAGGSMALVGPRPYLPDELPTLPEAARRPPVRPGITGLWQVSGRADLSLAERVHLDEEYVAHRSLLLDARILARTLPAVISGRGAY